MELDEAVIKICETIGVVIVPNDMEACHRLMSKKDVFSLFTIATRGSTIVASECVTFRCMLEVKADSNIYHEQTRSRSSHDESVQVSDFYQEGYRFHVSLSFCLACIRNKQGMY